MKQNFDVAYIIASLPALLEGMRMTIIVSAISITLAIVIGVAGASVRIFNTPILSLLARALCRVHPQYAAARADLLHLFRACPRSVSSFPIFWSGIVALTIWGGAYNSKTSAADFYPSRKGMRGGGRSARDSTDCATSG